MGTTTLELPVNREIGNLKKDIENKVEITADNQTWIFNGKVLDNF